MLNLADDQLQLLTSLVFFTVGAIVAGVANNFTALLAGRSVQGIGGGGILALSEIIVTDLVPLRQRGKWFGFLSAMWAVGSTAGPIVGGSFAQNGLWPNSPKAIPLLTLFIQCHGDGFFSSSFHFVELGSEWSLFFSI